MSVGPSRPPSDFELNYCSNPALILRFFCSGTNMLKVLDESCLARAVRAEQSEDVTRLDFHVDFVDGSKLAETFGKVDTLYGGVHGIVSLLDGLPNASK